MNDITIITATEAPEFINKQLRNATEKIFKIGATVRKCAFATAKVIYDVNESECYKEDGFNSVHEWTAKTFGFKKSASYTLLKIGTEYIRELKNPAGKVTGYESNLLPEESEVDFTTTQIEKMLPLGHETAVELVEDEEITPDMTCKEIEKVVKAHTKPESESDKDTAGETEEDGEPDRKEYTVTDKDGNRYIIPWAILKLYREKK